MTDMKERGRELGKQIELEVRDYINKDVDLGDNIKYSQYRLTRRIVQFESKTYPTGNFDIQGNYKYWFDVILPAINSEIKNIDFDTKNITAYSPRKIDATADIIINLRLVEWLRLNGQAEELNSAIEQGTGWGNIVWKRIKNTYERMDLKNFYVINQTAESLKDSPAIERHQFSQTKLHKMQATGKFQNLDKILAECGENTYKSDQSVTDDQETTTPYYLFFERNGEVSLAFLKRWRGEEATEDDENNYVYAKVIGAGTESKNGGVKIKYVAFAQEAKNPYKEYHRSLYRGKWFREGMYELLFDHQVRANEVGNQIAQGLGWSSKTIFKSNDQQIDQNIMEDMLNGDIIKSKDLEQVQTRMQGADQLFAEWNRIKAEIRELSNSTEVVRGESSPGQPFKQGQLLNANSNKLFDFIREKLSIPLREVFEEWIIPELIKELKVKDVLRLTGDSDVYNRLIEAVVENWYIDNLVDIGPHGPEVAQVLKGEKIAELKRDDAIFIKEFNKLFKDYRPNAAVIITGENIDLPAKKASLATFIQLESDPVRRTHLIERVMKLDGIDIGDLPKSTPDQLAGSPRPDTQVPEVVAAQ